MVITLASLLVSLVTVSASSSRSPGLRSSPGVTERTLTLRSWGLGRIFTAAAKSLQLCPTLCDPIDGSPPASAVPGILQARTLEWVAISFSNAWKRKVKVKLLSPCPTLSNPTDCSLPGSSGPWDFSGKSSAWGAIAFSQENS